MATLLGNPVGANRLFEYCVAQIRVDLVAVTPLGLAVPSLNELGYYGWELITVLQTMQRDVVVGFFRRDLLPSAPPPETAPPV